jgi:hypothetical protein
LVYFDHDEQFRLFGVARLGGVYLNKIRKTAFIPFVEHFVFSGFSDHEQNSSFLREQFKTHFLAGSTYGTAGANSLSAVRASG